MIRDPPLLLECCYLQEADGAEFQSIQLFQLVLPFVAVTPDAIAVAVAVTVTAATVILTITTIQANCGTTVQVNFDTNYFCC